MLLNNKVITQERVLTRFKSKIRESDLVTLSYLIDLSTKLPDRFYVDTHDLVMPSMRLYEMACQTNPQKIKESTLHFRLKNNFFSRDGQIIESPLSQSSGDQKSQNDPPAEFPKRVFRKVCFQQLH